MAKSSPMQASFNGGEWSPLMKGRADLDKYKSSCEILENFLPRVQGPAQKRPGTRYIGPVKNSAHNTHLLSFQYSTEQAYVLEFGNQYIRFYRDGGRILEANVTITGATQANPVVITAVAHGYNNGDYVYISSVAGMVELNNRYFTVANKTTDTFELQGEDGTSHTAYTSGGTVARVYEIATPYLESEVGDLDYAQTADVMYIAHANHPPQKLSRLGHASWTIADVTFDWPPFDDENVEELTIDASATTGTGITLTASAALFTSDMVGLHIKLAEVIESKNDKWETAKSVSANDLRYYDGNLYEAAGGGTTGQRPPIHTEGTESDGAVNWDFLHDGAGYVIITAFTSSTVVTADVVKTLPDSAVAGSGTKKWSFGAWSNSKGWPVTVTFYEDRLWFAGSATKPQTLWASTSGDYENHQYGTEDDDALNYTINAVEMNTIQWLSPGKVLAIGSAGGEFIMSASSSEAAITPTDVRIVPHTSYGSARERPLKIGKATLFIQKSQRKLREFVYVFENDSFEAPNMNILAEHTTDTGIVELAFQQEPYQIVWAPTQNGELAGLTYERPEDVVGWHRQVTQNGLFKSVVTIPHWDGDQDVVFFVVQRIIDGNTVKYVEYMEKNKIDDYACFMDCALTYDGSPVTILSGLEHLEGEEVSIYTDGYVHPNRTVTNGEVTLQKAASIVTIGIPLTATLKTLPVEAGSQNGVAQGKTVRINQVVIRLHETGSGLFYGPDENNLDELHFRKTTDPMDEPVPLFTGDTKRLAWPGGYEKQAQMTIVHSSPLPCTIVALMPIMETYDR